MEHIRFQFTGGMSDNHEMNFYEAGRFQYGAARFIYTLEKFRQEGRIASRLTTKVNADIRVKAPEQGSFIQDVIIFAAPVLAETSIQCSFEALFAYVWNLLLPSTRANDVAVEISKQEVLREKQKTLQEVERTKQLQTVTEVTLLMGKVALEAMATTQETQKILKHVVENRITLANDAYRLGHDEIKALSDEADANLEREQVLKENQHCFSNISPETERKLASQLRKSINDLTLPLRSSATGLNISQINTQGHDTKTAYLNEDSAKAIALEFESDLPIMFRGAIKAYDVETGCGKFRYGELQRPILFRVPAASKDILRAKITDALRHQGDILISAFTVKDSYGTPVRLILDNILNNENLDDMSLT